MSDFFYEDRRLSIVTAISSSALHSALCVLPYRSFVLEHNKQWIKTVKGRDRGQEIFKVFLVYVKLSIPDIIPYNNFNIQTTAIVNVYTPVFVENKTAMVVLLDEKMIQY